MSTRLWDRAASLPVAAGRPRPELVALGAGLPTVEELFSFMRDAELRFDTLRMRIEERTGTARGEHLVVIETTLRHPGLVKILTTEPGEAAFRAPYELWLSDGETVRTYASARKLGTQRPLRLRVRGTDDPDLPGMSRVYLPVTALPAETLPEVFIHPAGYAQNVLATGDCAVTGTTEVAGREAIVLTCAHPRAVEMTADRPDFAVRVAVDRADGVILQLVETMGGRITRDARVVVYETDLDLPPSAFEFAFPADTTFLY